MQHPGYVELAHRQRDHHKRPGENAVATVGHHHGKKALPQAGTETSRRLFQPRHLQRLHRAQHKRQGKQHVTDQNEQPAIAQAGELAVQQDDAQRGGEARQRNRQHQALFDARRPAPRRF